MLADFFGQILADLIGELLPPRAKAGLLLLMAAACLVGAGVLLYIAANATESDDAALAYLGTGGCSVLVLVFWYVARRTVLDSRDDD